MSVSQRKAELVRKLKSFQNVTVDGPAGPHLRGWCDEMVAAGKHWAAVSLTQVVVRSLDGLYLLEELVRYGMTDWIKPLPSLDEWERMYRRPTTTLQHAFDFLYCVPKDWREFMNIPDEWGPVGSGTITRVLRIGVRLIARKNPEELKAELKEYLTSPEGLDTIRQAWQLRNKTYDALLSSPIAAEMDDATLDKGLEQTSVQFLFLVLLPCWLEYGESASQLLERAETGDIPALERLVRLDKRAFYFPRIRQLVDESIRNRIEGSFALTADAFAGVPKPQLKLERLKIALATFVLHRSRNISAIGVKLFGPPLTKRDLFDAFNAAARDRGLKRDVTLPYDEETFSKRIDREKRFRTAAAWDIFSA